MQVVETLPPDRTVPVVMTIAIHVVFVYVLAISVGVMPTPSVIRDMVVVDRPVEVKPLPPTEPLDIDPRALVVGPSQDTILPPDIPQEIEIAGPRDVTITVGAITEPPVIPQMTNVRLLSNSEPIYPPASRRLGEEGVVYVRATVTPLGAIGEVTIEKSSGFSRLDEAALKAVRDWRFAPAMRGAQAIVGSVTIPVRFELHR